MPSHLDTLQIPVTCPKCGHEFTKTFRELKVNTNLGCPKCAQDFNAGDLKPALQKAEMSVDDLLRQASRFGKSG
jgi:protein-arginine kinase activator protein McsA